MLAYQTVHIVLLYIQTLNLKLLFIAKLLAICSNFIYLDKNIFSLEYGEITGTGTNKITIPLSNSKQYFWAIDINNYNSVYSSQEGAIATLSLPFNVVGGWSR